MVGRLLRDADDPVVVRGGVVAVVSGAADAADAADAEADGTPVAFAVQAVSAVAAAAPVARFVQLAHVLLQVEVAAEALLAVAAGEGLLLVVRVHVEGQIVDLKETNRRRKSPHDLKSSQITQPGGTPCCIWCT